jgi:hypothetical protein
MSLFHSILPVRRNKCPCWNYLNNNSIECVFPPFTTTGAREFAVRRRCAAVHARQRSEKLIVEPLSCVFRRCARQWFARQRGLGCALFYGVHGEPLSRAPKLMHDKHFRSGVNSFIDHYPVRSTVLALIRVNFTWWIWFYSAKWKNLWWKTLSWVWINLHSK